MKLSAFINTKKKKKKKLHAETIFIYLKVMSF